MVSKQNMEDVENLPENDEVDETMNVNDTKDGVLYDSIDDDIELKWYDDDVDDVSITNEDALLEDETMETSDNLAHDSKEPKGSNTDETPGTNIDEDKLNECTDQSKLDELFEPAKGHGLNKPDMMLDIPTQDLSDLSDDEDLTNLNMSPDMEMEQLNTEKKDDLFHSKNIIMESDIKEVESISIQENLDDLEQDVDIALSEEAKQTVDFLTKELAGNDDNADVIAATTVDENSLPQDAIEELDVLDEEKDYGTVISEKADSEDNLRVTNKKEQLFKSVLASESLEENNKDETKTKEVECLEINNEKNSAEIKEVFEADGNEINKDMEYNLKVYSEEEASEITEMSETKDSDKLNALPTPEREIQEPLKRTRKCLSLVRKPVVPKTSETDIISIEDSLNADTKEEKMDFHIDPKPSTSGLETNTNNAELVSMGEIQLSNINDVPKATSPVEDVPETTDSLGLLAESLRMTGDDEVEDDGYDMDDEEVEDFEPFDESSNQMTAEHSEDSEQHHSDNANETPTVEKDFTFTITDVVTENVKVQNENVSEKMDESEIDNGENESGDIMKNKFIVQENRKKTNIEDQLKNETQLKSEGTMSFVELEDSSEEDALDAKKTKSEIENMELLITEGVEEKLINKEDMELDEAEASKTELVKERFKSPAKDEKKLSQGLEVFNLDSDEDDEKKKDETIPPETEIEPTPQSQLVKCINKSCPRKSPDYYIADVITVNFYDPERKKRGYVCQTCLNMVEERNQILISGVRSLAPLLQLEPGRPKDDLVEISDSESEDGAEPEEDEDVIGEDGARFIEENLAEVLNETWVKYNMDSRLQEAQEQLQGQLENLQKDSLEINQLLDECQLSTDKLRSELYSSFERDIKELPSLLIYDVPNCSYTCVDPSGLGSRLLKRRNSSVSESSVKKSAKISDQSSKLAEFTNEKTEEENADVSVVHLSVEAAPPDLPPAGEVSYPPVKVGMTVYAAKNALGSWMKAKIVEITPKSASPNSFTLCRVKYEYKQTKPTKILPARCLAYLEPPDVRMTIGTRVIALFKDITMRESFYPGIVAEIPNPVNNYRYLVFFDDGYAQYAPHSKIRLVCECSSHVWEEVQPKSREFVRKYLLAYPERPMVRLHPGQSLKTEWRDNWWSSVVIAVDASLVEVQFLQLERREWIYRGSTRLAPLYLELQAAERHRPRALPRAQTSRTNMPYVEYTRSEEQTNKQGLPQIQNDEYRRQRAVAKKSTTETRAPLPTTGQNLDNVTSRVVYYTPKKQVKPLKMVPHTCTPKCRRTDVLALKDLRTYNPLAKPLLSGWERQIVRFKGNKAVLYVSPCGRRVRSPSELHRYLRAVNSDLPVDLFDFTPSTHCLAEFVLNKCYVGKKDLSHGKENVPVPCVNYYDESLPEFCSYNTERTPTTGVPLNLDPEFLCGCDCEDDCEDKSKCSCWKLTLEGARTIGLEGENIGYEYKRLPEPLPSGIYECNSRCKCKETCLNRVAQHPLQLKLQVFKTLNRGWGIRALNDIPKGAFVCVYAGNLLTDATANLDGLNEGDEYLAELDYIEVVEQMKEGYEDDIPDNIKKIDEAALAKKQLVSDDEIDSSSSEEESNNKNGEEDDDFRPGYIGLGVAEFNKRLRRRDSKVDKDKEKSSKEKDKIEKRDNEDDCITISDDEEVREPSNFTAAAGMGANEFKSKYRSVRTLFGEDEACYIMDAKVQGNIGRYLNHSCVPNVFVQNVFVDTHDPRFPWVAFFALRAVRAGGELTWNYNYDVGSVPGKVLYCYCGAPTCRGRLL